MYVGRATPAWKRWGKLIAAVWLASQGPHIYGLSVPRLAPAFTRGVGTAIHQAHRSRGKRLSCSPIPLSTLLVQAGTSRVSV